MTMKVKEIIRVLHAYQKWRRGADIPMPDPKEIGRAIDKVSGKGTWNMNPFVVVYGFELVK